MNSPLKVNDFVLIPSGHSAIVTEVHAKAKTVKVNVLGYFAIGDTVPMFPIFPAKKVTLITKDHAWKIAPRFPGIDC
jgi:hypothetical protein